MDINTKLLIALAKLCIMQRTNAIAVAAVFSKCEGHIGRNNMSFCFWQHVYLKTWWRMMNLTYTALHVKNGFICVKSARPGIGRCYRRRPATVRFLTTQGTNVENRLVPERFLNSLLICESLKQYGTILFVSLALCRSMRFISRDCFCLQHKMHCTVSI